MQPLLQSHKMLRAYKGRDCTEIDRWMNERIDWALWIELLLSQLINKLMWEICRFWFPHVFLFYFLPSFLVILQPCAASLSIPCPSFPFFLHSPSLPYTSYLSSSGYSSPLFSFSFDFFASIWLISICASRIFHKNHEEFNSFSMSFIWDLSMECEPV